MDDERLSEEMLRHWEDSHGYLPVKAGPILCAEVRFLRVERDAKERELTTWRRIAAERTEEASILRQEREGLQAAIAEWRALAEELAEALRPTLPLDWPTRNERQRAYQAFYRAKEKLGQ
jgi:hypothetical protein